MKRSTKAIAITIILTIIIWLCSCQKPESKNCYKCTTTKEYLYDKTKFIMGTYDTTLFKNEIESIIKYNIKTGKYPTYDYPKINEYCNQSEEDIKKIEKTDTYTVLYDSIQGGYIEIGFISYSYIIKYIKTECIIDKK
jgi:hypothetical protein